MTFGVNTNRELERVARESYGRLVAYLAAKSRDVAAAEDALSDSFRAALENWPGAGVPDNPDAWLLTAARRRLIDGARHAQVVTAAHTELLHSVEDAYARAAGNLVMPDRRLDLLFICAHPAIDAAARAPLMLQTVLGLDAARIASAWDDIAGTDPRRKGLVEEAIDLGRLLTRLMPSQPEGLGLLALMLHCEARRKARRAANGSYIPLSSQDVLLWSKELIEEAEDCLARAASAGNLGRSSSKPPFSPHTLNGG